MRHVKTRRTATAVGLVTLLASGGAMGAAQWQFSDWDQDGDLELTEREFVTGATEQAGMYQQWDAGNNDQLDEQEFYGGLYEAWDQNGDGQIGEQEFTDNAERWLTDGNYDFAARDTDGDGTLGEDEFRNGIAESDVFSTWAGDDQTIGEEEFYSGLYGIGDEDDDEALTQDEAGWFEDTMGTDVAAAGATGGAAAGATGGPLQDAEVVSLSAWGYDELYAQGWRAEWLLDSEVYGPDGEEIGEVEDFLVGPDGKILSIIAEVGGFWDIGDTHISVPWDQVEIGSEAEYVQIPVTEENVADYGLYRDRLTAQTAASEVVTGVDDAEAGYRAWRVNELIGDYTYLEDRMNYGYVDDLIFNSSGEIKAVVVQPDVGYGVGGYYAYPYYGYGYGWNPGYDYYNLPYTAEEAGELERFDYGELDEEAFAGAG